MTAATLIMICDICKLYVSDDDSVQSSNQEAEKSCSLSLTKCYKDIEDIDMCFIRMKQGE